MPKRLDLSELSEFEDEAPRGRREGQGASQQDSEPWPSREAPSSKQISVRMDVETLRRFQRRCKAERRTYGDMIGVMLAEYEDRH